MNPELKRIEATLDQLNAQGIAPTIPLTDLERTMQPSPASPLARSASTVKPTIQPFPLPKPPEPLPSAPHPEPSANQQVAQPATKSAAKPAAKPANQPAAKPAAKPASQTARKAKGQAQARKASRPPSNQPVHPFPAQHQGTEAPAFPRSKPASFSSHRHAVNPNLAISLLKEVETVVVGWQLELEQTVLEIQALYLEGPIVDGWLESHPYGSPQVTQPIGAATLRHAEIDRLMEYVEEICRAPQTDAGEAPRTGYRLCGLDADGQLWSRPCPAQQVPYVSLAIARYQKLRILFARKQNLETRLNQLIQNLTLLHGQMQESF